MNILFLGGDTRYIYMAQELSDKHTVSIIGFNSCFINNKIIKEKLDCLNLNNYDVVVLPMNGINDNMEIKSLDGQIKLNENFFKY